MKIKIAKEFFESKLDIYTKISVLNYIDWDIVKLLCWINSDVRKIVNTVKYWSYKISLIFGKELLPKGKSTPKQLYVIFKKEAKCQYDNGEFAPCRQYICGFKYPNVIHPDSHLYCKVHLEPFCQYKYVRGRKKGEACTNLVYKAIRPKSDVKGSDSYCYTHLNSKGVIKLLESI